MPTLEKLVDGFKLYKANGHEQQKDAIVHRLQAGMKPSTLVITSSDNMVAPDILTTSNPGDLYTVRMKAGLVPPFDATALSGFGATLEYAVMTLQVQNIVVLGHSHNDGLEMVLNGMKEDDSDPLKHWLGIANEVAESVRTQMAEDSREMQLRAMELECVVMGLRNLFSYPWIESRVNKGQLEMYGWHFDVLSGQLLGYMPNEGTFAPFE